MAVVIGITGSLGSGKTAVAGFLKERGFEYFSLSNVVREEAARRGIALERKALQDLGDRMRIEDGNGALAKRILPKIRKNSVIDSIRNPGEVEVLRKLKGFVLIAVDAGQKARFERIKARNRESDPKTFEEFVRVDKRDLGINEPGHGQKVGACMRMADVKLVNNFRSELEFRKAVDTLCRRS